MYRHSGKSIKPKPFQHGIILKPVSHNMTIYVLENPNGVSENSKWCNHTIYIRLIDLLYFVIHDKYRTENRTMKTQKIQPHGNKNSSHRYRIYTYKRIKYTNKAGNNKISTNLRPKGYSQRYDRACAPVTTTHTLYWVKLLMLRDINFGLTSVPV